MADHRTPAAAVSFVVLVALVAFGWIVGCGPDDTGGQSEGAGASDALEPDACRPLAALVCQQASSCAESCGGLLARACPGSGAATAVQLDGCREGLERLRSQGRLCIGGRFVWPAVCSIAFATE